MLQRGPGSRPGARRTLQGSDWLSGKSSVRDVARDAEWSIKIRNRYMMLVEMEVSGKLFIEIIIKYEW
jgi:hypothetical protein